jgi:hypothetical protein
VFVVRRWESPGSWDDAGPDMAREPEGTPIPAPLDLQCSNMCLVRVPSQTSMEVLVHAGPCPAELPRSGATTERQIRLHVQGHRGRCVRCDNLHLRGSMAAVFRPALRYPTGGGPAKILRCGRSRALRGLGHAFSGVQGSVKWKRSICGRQSFPNSQMCKSHWWNDPD